MVADGLDVDFQRLHVGGGDEFMLQSDEYYDDGTAHGGTQSCKKLAAFQLFDDVAFATGKQYGEDVEHHDTPGVDHNLHGAEEGVTQQEVDACRAESTNSR